ncbi:hypothetical protein [Xaviernesmea oryzae]|nr:hypothetical protein [Xaviernesmea oryzae]SEM13738.1 hypothetical protein SAMN04487976_12059 [Xaviernesmea oryzae]
MVRLTRFSLIVAVFAALPVTAAHAFDRTEAGPSAIRGGPSEWLRDGRRHHAIRHGDAPRHSSVTVERRLRPGWRDRNWRQPYWRHDRDGLGGSYAGLNVWHERGNGMFVQGGAVYDVLGPEVGPLPQARIIRVTPYTHACSMEAGVCVIRGR